MIDLSNEDASLLSSTDMSSSLNWGLQNEVGGNVANIDIIDVRMHISEHWGKFSDTFRDIERPFIAINIKLHVPK